MDGLVSERIPFCSDHDVSEESPHACKEQEQGHHCTTSDPPQIFEMLVLKAKSCRRDPHDRRSEVKCSEVKCSEVDPHYYHHQSPQSQTPPLEFQSNDDKIALVAVTSKRREIILFIEMRLK